MPIGDNEWRNNKGKWAKVERTCTLFAYSVKAYLSPFPLLG
jgi:hypothetical protein